MNIHIFILFNFQTIIQKVKIFFLIQKKTISFIIEILKKSIEKTIEKRGN